jgi:hypothetical protein
MTPRGEWDYRAGGCVLQKSGARPRCNNHLARRNLMRMAGFHPFARASRAPLNGSSRPKRSFAADRASWSGAATTGGSKPNKTRYIHETQKLVQQLIRPAI